MSEKIKEELHTIKDADSIILVKDLIEELKPFEHKELMIHVWVVGEEEDKGKLLVGSPEILGEIYKFKGADEETYNLTIMFGEWELEDSED